MPRIPRAHRRRVAPDPAGPSPVRRAPRRHWTGVLTLLCASLLVGCDRDEIVSYTAPPDAPRPTAPAPVPASPPAEASLAWDAPADWRPAANPPRFVLAAYDAGPADDAAQATVSQLGGTGGGALANINRWRGQIGLAPVAELSELPITPLDIRGDAAALVDLVGPAQRIVAVIYPRQEHDETWFFKLTGPPTTVEAHKQALIDLVMSTRPTAPAEPAP